MGTKIGTVGYRRGDSPWSSPCTLRGVSGPKRKRKSRSARATRLFDKDYLGVAIRHYTEAIRLNPNWPKPMAIGLGLLAQGRVGQGDRRTGTEAIRLNPKLVEAYGNRGLVY